MFVRYGYRRLIILIGMLMVLMIAAACGAAPKTGNPHKETDTQQLRKMELLNQTADVMYKKAMDGQVMEARNLLLQLSDQITHMHFEGITTLEGLNALTESVTQAKRVYNAANFSQNEGQVAVAKIRLATDALSHSSQPMWLQYDKMLQNDLTLIEQAVKSTKEQDALAGFHKFDFHISLIHPSLLISRELSEVEKLDSLMAFVRAELNKKPIAFVNVEMGVKQLRLTLDEMFDKKQETTAYLPLPDTKEPIIWALGIGAIISTVLTFAGWRMFKSGRDLVSVNKKEEG